MMKTPRIMIGLALAVAALQVVGCKSTGDPGTGKARVILDVYDPSHPRDVRMDGHWDTSQVRVFLDGQFLGSTPMEFSAERLRQLNLPDYKVKKGLDARWATWEPDFNGRLRIEQRENPLLTHTIELRRQDGDAPALIGSLATESAPGGGIRISLAFPDHSTDK